MLKNQSGFGLLDTMIAAAIMATMGLGMATMLANQAKNNQAQKIMVTKDNLALSLQRSAADPWVIQRIAQAPNNSQLLSCITGYTGGVQNTTNPCNSGQTYPLFFYNPGQVAPNQNPSPSSWQQGYPGTIAGGGNPAPYLAGPDVSAGGFWIPFPPPRHFVSLPAYPTTAFDMNGASYTGGIGTDPTSNYNLIALAYWSPQCTGGPGTSCNQAQGINVGYVLQQRNVGAQTGWPVALSTSTNITSTVPVNLAAALTTSTTTGSQAILNAGATTLGGACVPGQYQSGSNADGSPICLPSAAALSGLIPGGGLGDGSELTLTYDGVHNQWIPTSAIELQSGAGNLTAAVPGILNVGTTPNVSAGLTSGIAVFSGSFVFDALDSTGLALGNASITMCPTATRTHPKCWNPVAKIDNTGNATFNSLTTTTINQNPSTLGPINITAQISGNGGGALSTTAITSTGTGGNVPHGCIIVNGPGAGNSQTASCPAGAMLTGGGGYCLSNTAPTFSSPSGICNINGQQEMCGWQTICAPGDTASVTAICCVL